MDEKISPNYESATRTIDGINGRSQSSGQTASNVAAARLIAAQAQAQSATQPKPKK
jgi:hypothetical protein